MSNTYSDSLSLIVSIFDKKPVKNNRLHLSKQLFFFKHIMKIQNIYTSSFPHSCSHGTESHNKAVLAISAYQQFFMSLEISLVNNKHSTPSAITNWVYCRSCRA